MKCSKCGAEFNSAFCPSCGSPRPSVTPLSIDDKKSRKDLSEKNTLGGWAFVISLITLLQSAKVTSLRENWLTAIFLIVSIILIVLAIRAIRMRKLKSGFTIAALILCTISIMSLLPVFLGSHDVGKPSDRTSLSVARSPVPVATPTLAPVLITSDSGYELTSEEYQTLLSSFTAAGLDYSGISACEVVESDPVTVDFLYEDYLFIAIQGSNKLFSLKSGDVVFMKNGKLLETVDNRLLSPSEKIEIQYLVKQFVKDNLLAPVTANFAGTLVSPYENWEFAKHGNTYVVSSYVDSLNAFGVTIRNSFTVTAVHQGDQYKMSMDGFNR